MLTTEEVRAELRIKDRALRRLILSGDLVAVKVGRQYRISEEALADYLKRNQVQAEAASA